MKFVLFVLIVVSFLGAGSAYLGDGLAWTYWPHTAVGVARYEHSNWLVLFHLLVGTGLYFFWPETRSRKMMIVAVAIFLASIIIHFTATKIRFEKTGNVEIGDISYRVSSYELPLLDETSPLGSSPFRKGSNVIVQREPSSSLYFVPKKQFGFEALFKDEKAEKFVVVIWAENLERPDYMKTPENLISIKGKKVAFGIYPETAFTRESSPQKFQTFIETNMPLIEQDIAERTVIEPNAP